MFKPTSKTNAAPQKAADRAAIAVQVTEVEYDTTNPAWVTFDQQMSAQLFDMEVRHAGLATPLSLAKKLADKSSR
ncbi:hypothetical protein ETAA8_01510 [Anatilimnocola aggregata]|uniref:Uncharacterized protein n=1 Tax=Anatilimnocola aggregata TaxID=2528021 RepID=A0A517Y4I8_9BACT|nr:hypothetical protein [Anatilimnocola aggregata]QDU25090.1 hypothetical protein ETAA8_01510 [Anatilimnocola aggregata]